MPQKTPHGIYDLKQYREHTRVFRDRIHAGDVLARMLNPYVQDKHLVLGIPAAGCLWVSWLPMLMRDGRM